MADVITAQLCEQIIHTHFGPQTATAAATLIRRGRLSLPELIKYGKLKPRTARASVLVLVQHNLVWHAVSESEGEVLEFNVEECLLRLRFGRFVWHAEQLFGPAAGAILSIILDHGKLRPPEVVSRLAQSNVKADSVYSQAFFRLVSASYLSASTILSHISTRDKFIKYEAEERKMIKNFPTAKELREAKERAEARLRREQEEAAKIGMTRQRTKDNSSQKSTKRKTVEEEVVDDEVYFRANPVRLNVHIRDRLIENAVCERFNHAAASVIRAVLKAVDGKHNALADVRSDPVALSSIAMHVPDNDDVAAGLIYPSGKRPSTLTVVKDILGILAAADNPTPAGRASAFVSFVGQSSAKVQVEFEVICRRLRRRLLENVVREKHGDEGVRIVRYLIETGKMNGDQLAKVVMMSNKDIRPLLAALQEDSLVSIQEVPKGADRNPQRTFYLWYVDLPKVYSALLRNMYKTLFNISQRRCAEAEEATVHAVLEKCARSDVQADPSLLSRLEREVLQDWKARREKLALLELRVEEAVFVLRDLSVFSDEGD